MLFRSHGGVPQHDRERLPRRGAQLAVHSSLGYAGGFVGPLMIGVILDFAGGMSRLGWSLAFGSVAALMLAALLVFHIIRPEELAGDRHHAAAPPDKRAA